MIRELLFEVDVKPLAAARPRFRTVYVKGRPTTITHPAPGQEEWKERFADACKDHKPKYKISEPVEVNIMFVHQRPKAMCRKKDPDGLIWKPTRPDYDNLAKLPIDALDQAGWFSDDAVIVKATDQKCYAEKNGSARVVVQITAPGNPIPLVKGRGFHNALAERLTDALSGLWLEAGQATTASDGAERLDGKPASHTRRFRCCFCGWTATDDHHAHVCDADDISAEQLAFESRYGLTGEDGWPED